MSESNRQFSDEREHSCAIHRVTRNGADSREDAVAVEEPMEIRVVFGPSEKRTMRSLSVTMRTPGNDEELAAGFLFSEGIIASSSQIDGFRVGGVNANGVETGNIVRVDLNPAVDLDFSRLQRNFYTTSSCGVCGKSSLEALEIQGLTPLETGRQLTSETVYQLSDNLRAVQPTFARTGGLHASAFCHNDGRIATVREDVGRHNAVDKLIGRYFLDGQTPVSEYAMIISGRASFEILQKALVAGVPIIVAVGAPSSLAIELARSYNITLVGFASAERFNIYSGAQRISAGPSS